MGGSFLFVCLLCLLFVGFFFLLPRPVSSIVHEMDMRTTWTQRYVHVVSLCSLLLGAL